MTSNNIEFLAVPSTEEKRKSEELQAKHGLNEEQTQHAMAETLRRVLGADVDIVDEFLGLNESLKMGRGKGKRNKVGVP